MQLVPILDERKGRKCSSNVSDMTASKDNDARIALFQSIGLNEQKARETLKNQDVSRLLEATITEVTFLLLPSHASVSIVNV